MSVLTKAQIKKAEEVATENGTFSFRELMYNAGTAAGEIITQKFSVEKKNVAVVCGKGNNGGDGCVIAEYLKSKGAIVTVITPFGAPVTENAKYYYNQLTTKISNCFEDDYDFIVDAVFGIGFSGEVDNETKKLIKNINSHNAIRISVDIPSGVECDTGIVNSIAVNSDLTITFIAHKPCLLLPDGSDYCGEVVVADIGVAVTEKEYDILKAPIFKKRRHNSHKGTYGTALLIVGSFGMAGAAMLSAKAALRSGLGIAKCLIPKSIYSPFTCFLPEVVCIPVEDTPEGTIKFSRTYISKIVNNCNAVLFGCGSGKSKENLKILKWLLKNCKIPMIIDADGINTLATRIELLKQSKAPVILTPHPGEMARLCKTDIKTIEANRIKFAKQIALEYACTVVLKGSNTIIAEKNGNISFNILGNSGMATGGSGDVLAGIIVSLLSQGYSPEESAKFGVYVHSNAGDKAALKRSHHACLPTDIIEEL